MKLDLLYPSEKLIKGMNDWNVRQETYKLLEENLRKKFLDVGLGNDFRYET